MALSEIEKMEAILRFRMVNHGSAYAQKKIKAQLAELAARRAMIAAVEALGGAW